MRLPAVVMMSEIVLLLESLRGAVQQAEIAVWRGYGGDVMDDLDGSVTVISSLSFVLWFQRLDALELPAAFAAGMLSYDPPVLDVLAGVPAGDLFGIAAGAAQRQIENAGQKNLAAGFLHIGTGRGRMRRFAVAVPRIVMRAVAPAGAEPPFALLKPDQC